MTAYPATTNNVPFTITISHECTLAAITSNAISASTYYISHSALTIANLNWSIDRSPQCEPLTYELKNADLTPADPTIFTVGASTVTVYSTDVAKNGNIYNLILIAKFSTYVSA